MHYTQTVAISNFRTKWKNNGKTTEAISQGVKSVQLCVIYMCNTYTFKSQVTNKEYRINF